jgi:hypothetical protein
MNPFTKATMLLPKLCSYTTYSDPETIRDPNFERMWSNLKDISEICVLSLVVCSKRLIAVTVSTKGNGGRLGTLALCRPGDAAWSVGTNKLCRCLLDIVFFRGKLHALGFNNVNNEQHDLRAIEIVDENGNDEPRVSRIESIFVGAPRPCITPGSYLVESCGRLLMIRRKFYYRQETQGRNHLVLVAGSTKFEVFEADFGRMLWTELRSLGDDQALFVGRRCSRASRVSPYDLSCDSIFFVDDYTLVSKKTTTSCGVYDMKDGKVYSTLPMLSWMRGKIPATWLFCEGIEFMFFFLALKYCAVDETCLTFPYFEGSIKHRNCRQIHESKTLVKHHIFAVFFYFFKLQ